MLYRSLPLFMAVVVFAVFASLPVLAADETHEGLVVMASNGKLTMTDKDGKNEHTHDVATDARIQLDGKEAKLTDLKKGYSIKVTTTIKEGGKRVASKIEGRSNK